MPPEPDPAITSAVFDLAVCRLDDQGRRPMVLGICGAQGSGKSTLTRAVLRLCAQRGIAAAALSIDDLYLTKAERDRLAREVHPLLRTRGPPGTHDIALGREVLAEIGKGHDVALPRFDKAADDRAPEGDWPVAPGNCRLLVLEGWCVGARPQPAEALREPVNALEAREDRDGVWRRFCNDALAGEYQRFFDRIDALVLLAAPGFEVVFNWRIQQEEDLRRSTTADASGVMDTAAIARFIQHYERLTRHILAEMPERADLVIRLARDRTPVAIEAGGEAS